MIGTFLRIGWLNLKRDRAAQAMTFLLPIIFFSIFASVFGNQGGDAMENIEVAIVDEDNTEASRRLVQAITKETALQVRATRGRADEGDRTPLDRAAAENLVRAGTLPVAIVIPAGTAAQIEAGGLAGVKLTLLADPSDPIAPQVVQGLLQKAVMTNAPDLAISSGLSQFDQFIGMTEEQRKAMNSYVEQLKAEGGASAAGTAMAGVSVDVVNVVGGTDNGGSDLVAFYAAGVGVMFLLFSCSGASGALLDEVDSGTLERLISSRVGMTGVLAGKWIFIGLMGMLQLTVMFLWGWAVFGLDLWSHLPGFLIMTFFSAFAAASLGLVLATASRTRAQLSGLATIIILTMSALGGSMFPRFLMSETMQKMGLVTFNAWALDGYLKVFWRDMPITALWPQVLVLVTITIVLLALARVFARKWETV